MKPNNTSLEANCSMDKNWIELKTDELLDKFGAGKHIPGSGSAAVFQGLLSAQLIRTVVSLSCKKLEDQGWHSEFKRIDTEIENRIYPRLKTLFQEDSDQFDKVYNARSARDKAIRASDQVIAHQWRTIELEEMVPATEMVIEIAELCLELTDFALTIFDHGYQAVRGDSSVALNSAISAVAGCLSIIDLNLLSFGSDEWTAKIRGEAVKLRARYETLATGTTSRLDKLKAQTDLIFRFHQDFNAFWSDVRERKLRSDADIERVARQLQGAMWKNHKIIWKKNPPEDPVKMLKPELALELLGYQFEIYTTLGQHGIGGSLFEVAGQIDNSEKSVSISSQFPTEIRNFTAAHELGHALLHQQRSLHRDRALDGNVPPGTRDSIERQADKFATYFLMPKNLMQERFKRTFLVDQFVITADTAFALNYSSVKELREKAGSKAGLARILASAELYNGDQIQSIAKQFDVSVGAMAIRLDELDLLAWD